MRRFEERYRIQEADDILRKEDEIHQDLDLRLDAVEQDADAFRAGNRADIDAILKSLEQTFAGLAAEMRGLLDQTEGGLSADIIVETAARYFLTDARRAAILAELRGGVPAARQTLKALNDAVVANTATLTAITSGADPTLDSFAEALTRFVIDEGQISSIMTMLGKRLRFDAAQSLSSAEKLQAKKNQNLEIGRRYYTGNGGVVSIGAADLGGLIYLESDINTCNFPLAANYTDGDYAWIYARGTVNVQATPGDPYTFGFPNGNRGSFVMRPGDRCKVSLGADAWDVVSYSTTHDKALMADRPLTFSDAERQQLLSNAGLLIPVGQAVLMRVSATQIRLDRSRGSNIFVNGYYRTIPAVGVPANNSGLQPNSVFYTFIYWTGSALALAIGIGPPVIDPLYGHLVAGGQGSDAQNRLFTYVGAVLTDANGQFRDDDAFRGVASLFNSPGRTLGATITTSGSTASTAGVVLGTPLQFVMAEVGACSFRGAGTVVNDTAGKFCRTDLTLDQNAVGKQSYGESTYANHRNGSNPVYSGMIQPGAHAINLFGSVNGGTGYWDVALFGELP